jgi:hypothetical protein
LEDILAKCLYNAPTEWKFKPANIPYFSIAKAHLMYAHPKHFNIPFDVWITRMALTSGRVRKYRPLLTEDKGVIVIYIKNHCY